MAKEAITVTIDTHLHQWIKDGGGNKSKIVNSILAKAWLERGQRRRTADLVMDPHMTYTMRPSTPSENGVHYLITVSTRRVQKHLSEGYTLHDRDHDLVDQPNLIWTLNGKEVNHLGQIVGEKE